MKATNTTNISNSKISTTSEVSVGKKVGNGEAAAFVSQKNSSQNNNSKTSSQIDVGVKANYTYKNESTNSSITLGVKAGVIVQKTN